MKKRKPLTNIEGEVREFITCETLAELAQLLENKIKSKDVCSRNTLSEYST